MKKIINYTVFFMLIIISFYFTDKVATVSVNEDPLKIEIESIKDVYYIEPISAYTDPIYKNTPGLNGLEVNVNKSYEKMKVNGFDEKLLVFSEIKPDLVLDDLEAGPIFRGNEKKQSVAFMINVATGSEYIPDMLDIFDEYNLNVSFFVDGQFVVNHEQLIFDMAMTGHDIENHGYKHSDVKGKKISEIKEDIEYTNKAIYEIILKNPTFFTPPSGSFDENAALAVDELDMKLVLFSCDTIDWRKPSPEKIVHRVTSGVKNGSIILMHPTENTIKALPTIITELQNSGYKINTVKEHLSERR